MKVLVELYFTKDRMPEPHQLVIVDGGIAVWTGSVWLTKTHNDNRVIEWRVGWWMPIPSQNDLIENQSYEDLIASGGIVNAP